jgi:hypothetical protein
VTPEMCTPRWTDRPAFPPRGYIYSVMMARSAEIKKEWGVADDKLGRIISYDEDGAPIREDYCTHCGAGRTRGDHAAECSRAYRQALAQIACTCKCAPEEHGPNGCKTWFGDNNTGFRCNCDWRLLKYPKVREIAERMTALVMPPHLHRTNTANMTCWDCGVDLTAVTTVETCPVRAAQEKTLRSTHKDRLALDCGRQIMEMLQQKEATGVGIRGLVFGWSHEELRQEIAQIILKNGFEKL